MRSSLWFAQGTRFSEVMAGDAMSEFMRICPERPFSRGSYLFRQGDPATQMHVIAKGQVKLVTLTPEGNERVIAVLGPDDFLGEAFVIDVEHYLLDAVAITDVVACPMDRDQFTRLALHAPTFTVRFAEILATNLVRCRELLTHSLDPVKRRVAKVLLDQGERFGESVDGSDLVSLRTELRHDDIASLASATRVSASTAIAELRELGIVEGSRGAYRMSLEGLRAYVADEIG
jgi:CRP/FNR family transcriptional regulator, cyclic AMP receptor protein